MIHHPIALIAILLFIEIGILYLARHPRTSKYFEVLPAVFWIYFIPMLASSCGLIDPTAPIYSKITTFLLPMALFLLLMTVDLNAIIRLGPSALIMFFAGTVGIVVGIVSVFAVLKGTVGAEFWSGFATLSGSWTGGSANMIAVKEALGTPDEVFLPMVIVDTIVPYVWMALMVACVGLAPVFDRWNKSDRTILDDLQSRIKSVSTLREGKPTVSTTLGLSFSAFIAGCVCILTAQFLPQVPGVITTYAWTIILVSCLAIFISITPLRQLEGYGTTKIGYFVLYFVLTTIGAKASVTHLGAAFILLAAGFAVILIHAIVLLTTARIIKAPLFLAVVASQANIGGVASAPLVAEIYQKGFASVGLLLAILGNIEGTYIGILTGQICHFLAR